MFSNIKKASDTTFLVIFEKVKYFAQTPQNLILFGVIQILLGSVVLWY